MIILDIKPMSVNTAWQGRRFRTDTYKKYQRDIAMILPKFEVPEGLLELWLEFGFSNSLSDFDNPIKPFVDCLQKQYGFNDRRIKRAHIEVFNVSKGEEFITFDLKALIDES